MGTRSLIGAQQPDGTVSAIYCHFDGYLKHNGAILAGHYTNAEKVASLIALGDISTLGAEIGEKHPFNACPRGVCNAYGRDRGEDGTAAKTYATDLAFALAVARGDLGIEYGYLFRDGAWHVLNPRRGAWDTVADAMSAEADDKA